MRIMHIADTHLGYSAYSKVDSQGINQRETDFYDSFRQAIDKAIEMRPDVVIHAGDLFDTVRPQNRAIDFALKQLIRLSDEKIKTVLISGNHSTPRLRETGNIFRIFEHLDHIHSVHQPGLQKIVKGDLTIHAVPHSVAPPMHEFISNATPSGDTKYNVLVLHGGILGSNTYKMDEFNEQDVPASSISKDFDYVALGHFHRFTEVRRGMYYSGSTERLGFGEVGQTKGVIEVDLDEDKAIFHELTTRDMIDIPSIDASELTSSEILKEARERISASSIDDKIVRLTVSKVKPDAYRALEVATVRKLGSAAMHFELKVGRVETEEFREVSGGHIGSLSHEFQQYVNSLDMSDSKKRKLAEIGLPYFSEDEG